MRLMAGIWRILRWLALLLLLLVLLALLTHRALPDNQERPVSQPLSPDPHSLIGRRLAPLLAEHAGESGLYLLGNSRDAFAARLALVETAQRSLDLQYYIWHDDISGRLLMNRVFAAANRGVRVRLLLDDNTMAGMDGLLTALDRHANIQVRLFNPFMQRRFRMLGFLSDFFRLNRRMHNKSFTADAQVSIVGGRNIGDEYFQVSSGVMFADLDVMAVGEVVAAVTDDFQRYWDSESAYPLDRIAPGVAPAALDIRPEHQAGTRDYLEALARSGFVAQIRSGQLPWHWARARLISDAPAKALGKSRRQDSLFEAHIGPLMAGSERELHVISPYFVPTPTGSALLTGLVARGCNVTVLTNSLAANDVTVVHSGYAKYRKALLQGGVELYELKPDATIKPERQRGLPDSSGASLHAKTFVVDGRQVYVGSFNMDPRSARLNTEMGLILDSPVLAGRVRQGLEQGKAEHAYAVRLDAQGQLHWHTLENGVAQRFDAEPRSSPMQRFTVWLASRLPLEPLL